MIPYERRKKILELLGRQEVGNFEDFGKAMPDVSESTIRRDLKALEGEGKIVLLRGGAARLKSGTYDIPLRSRNITCVTGKEQIAEYAAGLVKDGEQIYVDSGTTTVRMLKFLKQKEITIVTSSAIAIQELQEGRANCIMLGGELNIPTASIYGSLTDRMLSAMYFDKAFLSAAGFSLEAGITSPDYREAAKAQKVLENTKMAFALLDSSKAGVSALCKICGIQEITIVSERISSPLNQCEHYLIVE